MRKVALVLLLSAVFSLKTNAQGAQEYADPYQLISIVGQKARENDRKKIETIAFRKTYTVHSLNSLGEPKSKNPDSKPGVSYEGAGRDNKPLPLDRNQVLETSYYFEFDPVRFQILNGECVYVIHFRPKDRFAEGANAYYKAANRANGTIYINMWHLYIQKIDAKMGEPFNILGILGRLRGASFIFEQKLRPDLGNLIVIDHFTAVVRYRKVFSEKHESHSYQYDDYQLVP